MQTILEKIDGLLQSYLSTSVVSFDLIQKEHPDIQQILKLFWMNQYNIGFHQNLLRSLMRAVIDNQSVIISNQKIILERKRISRKKNKKKKMKKVYGKEEA